MIILIFMIKSVFRSQRWFGSSIPRLFVFGGQGTQEKAMLSGVLQKNEARKLVQEASVKLGIDFEEIASTDKQNLINETQITQPLLLLTHYLLFKFQGEYELRETDTLLGHSLGEYSALTIAGVFDLIDGLQIVKKRGQLMKKSTKEPNGMLIVKYKKEQEDIVFRTVKERNLEVACYNTPLNIIIAGVTSKLNDAKAALRTQKISSIFLPVSTAFHCQMLEPMKQEFQMTLNSYKIQTPAATILRNIDCKPYESRSDIIEGLVKQITSPVLFYQSIQKIDPSIQCIQIGPKAHIQKFVQQTRNLL